MSLILSTGATWAANGSALMTIYNPRTPEAIAGVAPTLDYRFAQDRSKIEAVSLTDKLTVTTVDADGTYFGRGGGLELATANSPRFTHSTTTGLSTGLLLEQASTNSLINNTPTGARLGSPGTNPSTWVTISSIGLTRTVQAVGVEDGLPYIDIRWNGTTSILVSTGVLRFHASDSIPAVSGERWIASAYVKLVGGSFTGFTSAEIAVREISAALGFLAQSQVSVTNATSASLKSQRYAATRTFNNASTAYANIAFGATIPASTAIDVTLRFALPQLEKLSSGSATSVIPVTSGPATRSADDIKIAAGSGVITGTYTLVEKPAGCATVSGTDILLNTGYTAERVMVFPTSLSAGQITSIRAAM